MSRFVAALFVLALGASAQAMPTTYSLTIAKEGGLSGTGADVLHREIARAQFILYGQDEGFADSAIVLRAIAHDSRPQGFNDYIVEAGQFTTRIIASALARDGIPGVAKLVHEAPLATYALSTRNDVELAADFVGHDPSGSNHLWGIDQELMGAPALLLKRLVEIAPDAAARDIVNRLLVAERNPHQKFFLFTAKDSEFDNLAAGFKGVDEAQQIIAALRESAAIYRELIAGKNYEGQARRAALLRDNFLNRYRHTGNYPKFIVMMGGAHLGLGTTPNYTFDVGTLATSIAALNGKTALRIMFLPAGGPHTDEVVRKGNPFYVEDYDDTGPKAFFAGIGIDAKRLSRDGWTLIPLAPLRATFESRGMDKLTPFVRFVVLGYDYLITTPDAKPATPLY